MTGWPWTGVNRPRCQHGRRLQLLKVVGPGGREVGARREERRRLRWPTLGSTRSSGDSDRGCGVGRRGGPEGRGVREEEANFLSKRICPSPLTVVDN